MIYPTNISAMIKNAFNPIKGPKKLKNNLTFKVNSKEI